MLHVLVRFGACAGAYIDVYVVVVLVVDLSSINSTRMRDAGPVGGQRS